MAVLVRCGRGAQRSLLVGPVAGEGAAVARSSGAIETGFSVATKQDQIFLFLSEKSTADSRAINYQDFFHSGRDDAVKESKAITNWDRILSPSPSSPQAFLVFIYTGLVTLPSFHRDQEGEKPRNQEGLTVDRERRERESVRAAMEPKGQEVVEGGRAAAVAPRPRRPSQGKQRIQICFIGNKDRRQVTFSKRRKGLFKKASELSQLCGARVAVIVFSPAERSKAFAIGAPSVDAVLRAYAPLPGDGEEGARLLQDEDDDHACRAAVEAALRQAEETKARVVAEQARMDAVGEKVMRAMAGRRFWWEADVDQLGEAELPEFARALQRLRDNVQRHTDQLRSAAAAQPPPLPLQ